MGRWDEAVQINLHILELFPDDIQARNRLGKAYSELGRYDEAVATYEQNLQRQPSNNIARKRLADLYAFLKREPAVALGESMPGIEIMEEGEETEEWVEHLEEEDIEAGSDEDSND